MFVDDIEAVIASVAGELAAKGASGRDMLAVGAFSCTA